VYRTDHTFNVFRLGSIVVNQPSSFLPYGLNFSLV
jgi:hypothetical protein